MLGQPAFSQTVCRPSRRTSDFSSVYSGPVLSRVLIHSGLRSMGTWLLRTSRRSSLRPAGSIPEPEECAGAAVSLMTCTVLPTHAAPAASREQRGGYRTDGWSQTCRSSGPAVGVVGPVDGAEASPGVSPGTSSRPTACCAVWVPRSVSGGVASPGAVVASDTV